MLVPVVLSAGAEQFEWAAGKSPAVSSFHMMVEQRGKAMTRAVEHQSHGVRPHSAMVSSWLCLGKRNIQRACQCHVRPGCTVMLFYSGVASWREKRRDAGGSEGRRRAEISMSHSLL